MHVGKSLHKISIYQMKKSPIAAHHSVPSKKQWDAPRTLIKNILTGARSKSARSSPASQIPTFF